MRRALTGGKHQLQLGLSSPEQGRAQSPHLRRAFVRRRTASDSAPSSGQQPVTGGQQVTGTASPLRRALTGGRHQLLLGLASPEQGRAPNSHLRRALVRRRTASDSAPSSGQHSLAGAERITGTAPPLRSAHRRKAPAPIRIVFAGSRCSKKNANSDGMQILQGTIQFRRRRENGI